MWQVSNPEAAESLDLFMKSDYDEEDKDWAITIKAPGHWLRKCGVDPSKSGYSWQSYDDNNDVWINPKIDWAVAGAEKMASSPRKSQIQLRYPAPQMACFDVTATGAG